MLFDDLEEWDGREWDGNGRGGREVQEGGAICTHTADLLHCIAET